jgi:hypothetical protein
MDLPGRERPGVIAMEDALRASPDFLILRATRGTADLFEKLFLADVPMRKNQGRLFPIRSPRSRSFADPNAFMTVYDADLKPVLEFGLGQRERGPVRYVARAGVEYLADGLRLLYPRQEPEHRPNDPGA